MLEKLSISKEEEENLRANWQKIQDTIRQVSNGKDVRVLAATKTVSADRINYAIDHLGLSLIGENRVQELLAKYDDIHKDRVKIHFIGRLQTNKVKYIIDKVDMIESVDNYKLAEEISRRALRAGRVMDVLIEVNVGSEESKGGVSIECLEQFLDEVQSLEGICIAGMMVIPPRIGPGESSEKYFLESYRIFLDIQRKKLHNIRKPLILSMGMSDSYEEAIRCGSDEVRLGSALFGKRNYPAQIN